MDLLTIVNILLGVAVVMLVVSLVVTSVTQGLIALTNARARHLCGGLSGLLRQIDPSIELPDARRIAIEILQHPRIADVGGRMGSVVQRHEFTELIFGLAAREWPGSQSLAATVQHSLANLGIENPAGVLESARLFALKLEASNPEASNAERHDWALMTEAGGQFLARLHSGFDATMDRVGERFAYSARLYTAAAALLVAFFLQLDTVALINRLSVDSAFRDSLAKISVNIGERPAPAAAQPPQQTPAAPQPPAPESDAAPIPAVLTAEDREALSDLARLGIISPMKLSKEWWQAQPKHFPGILLSTALLSFGAPFWYSALKNLLKLRSALASRDEEERRERSTTTASPSAASPSAKDSPAAPAPPRPVPLALQRGESGAMEPVG